MERIVSFSRVMRQTVVIVIDARYGKCKKKDDKENITEISNGGKILLTHSSPPPPPPFHIHAHARRLHRRAQHARLRRLDQSQNSRQSQTRRSVPPSRTHSARPSRDRRQSPAARTRRDCMAPGSGLSLTLTGDSKRASGDAPAVQRTREILSLGTRRKRRDPRTVLGADRYSEGSRARTGHRPPYNHRNHTSWRPVLCDDLQLIDRQKTVRT